MIQLNRRNFLKGCSAAIAGMAGAKIGLTAFGNVDNEPNQRIIIPIFLRGACDVLSVVTPMYGDDRAHYETARPDLRIPVSDLIALDSQFGLHPSATALHDIFQDNKLSFILGTGMHSDTRSHFDAMAYMEGGTPNRKGLGGWLTRYLRSATNINDDAIVTNMTTSSSRPRSLSGTFNTLAGSNLQNFNIRNDLHWQYRDQHQSLLQNLYALDDSFLHQAGQEAFEQISYISNNYDSNYTAAGGVTYPNNSFSSQLETIAQIIKLQIGLKVAAVDLGGWDTHDGQANGSDPSSGYFANLLTTLSEGIGAFFADLSAESTNYADRVTIVVMSEFGRRVRENAERGTDHGHGSMMMLIGGQVQGGIKGIWPGLHNDQLYDAADLAVKVDYRQVLSEILIRRMEAPKIGTIFPNYEGYTPLNLVQGVDLEPDYTAEFKSFLPQLQK